MIPNMALLQLLICGLMVRFHRGSPLFDTSKPHLTPTESRWSYQDLVETFSQPLMNRFKLLRADATKVTVATRRIVERIDVVSHIG